MRNYIFLLLLIFMIPVVNARKPKVKAGTVKDRVYLDKKYNFKLTLKKGWKYKVKANKKHYRLILTQMNYDIPPNYLDAPDYTLIPRTAIFVDTTTLSVPAFIDSLLSKSYKSKQKKEILKEFEFLDYTSGGSSLILEKMVPRKRKNLKIADERGMLWTGQVRYRNEVAVSAASLGAKRVYGAYGGIIIGVKKENVIILFLTSCEWTYFDNILEETLGIVNSLEWISEKTEKK